MPDNDLADALLGFTNYVMNERVRCYNEGVDVERERCATVAEHLSGWGSAEPGQKRASELAAHIANVIRQ